MPEEFEAVGVKARHRAPGAEIDPNQELGWMRRLVPVILQHKRPLVVGAVSGVLALLFQVAVPAVGRAAIDAAGSQERSDLTALIFVLLGLGIGRFVLGLTYRYSLFQLAWGVETDLRALLYDHLTRLSFSYYDRTQSGEVISRANSDIRSIQVLLAFGPLILMSVLAFVIAFGFMLTIHVPLTLVALSTLPLVYVFGQKLRTTVFPLTWVSQARMAELATIVDENVNGTRVVKSFAAEERQVNLLARAADHLRWVNVEAIRTRATYNPYIEALPRIGMALVLLYGGLLAIDGQVSIGTLFAFNAYVIMLQAPFRMFGFMLLQTQRAAASASRVYEVLDEPAEVADAEGAFDMERPAGSVEFRDVDFTYPSAAPSVDRSRRAERLPVLNGLNLSIAPGETIAIVGRTGSGKSTIARLLARFYHADSGEILIDGRPHRSRHADQPASPRWAGVRRALLVLYIGTRQHRVRASQRGPRGRRCCSDRRAGTRLYLRAQRWLRHRGWRTWLHAVWRTTPAHCDRTHVVGKPSDPGPRRRDQRDRCHGRGRDS